MMYVVNIWDSSAKATYQYLVFTHCKFFHGEFYRFCLCNFAQYSLTMIFTEKDFETNHLKIYENYLLIP